MKRVRELLTAIRDARAEALAAAERMNERNLHCVPGAVSADDLDRSLLAVLEARIALARAEIDLEDCP